MTTRKTCQDENPPASEFHQRERGGAGHRRVNQPGWHTTISAHMPEQRRHWAQFSREFVE